MVQSSAVGRVFGDDDKAADRLADYIDYVLEVQGDVAALKSKGDPPALPGWQ